MSEVQKGPPKRGAHEHLADAARAMERFRFTTSRPVAVLMVFLAVVVFGAFSMGLLPLNLMPDIAYPKLTVRTEYEGAAPAEVENNVSRPMEEILGVVTGLTRIESISRAGYSDVILEFAWDTDMDEANQDVLEKIDSIKPVLPEEVKQPLILRYDPTLDPVMTVSLSGDDKRYQGVAGLKRLRRIGDREVRRLIEPVEGVAAVKIKGGLEEEIQVDLDEDELRRTGIGIGVVVSRLEAENINVAGGSMRDGRTRYLVRTVNEFKSLDDIRDTVILTREGRDVRLRHIAKVTSGFKDRDVITRVDGKEAVEVEIYKEADANVVEMAKRVRERLSAAVKPRLEKEFQADVKLISDRSTFIEASIDEVRNTALMGGLLAVAVLFLFLRDLRSTVIVAVAIPVSILVTFAPMKLSGVSLNIMSLGGLALGIGMLVDNSIVVLESIHRCREEGDDIIRATIRGTAEVGSAVFASTLTSIAVFFPMIFVEGVAGQMFGDLGLTVVFSLLASLAVALFLIPMLASRRGLAEVASDRSAGIGTGLLRTWKSWPAFGDFVSGLKGAGRWNFAVVPFAYLLVRFVAQLAIDLVGKILTTVVIANTALLGLVLLVLSKGVGLLLRPVLWAFNALIGAVERGYPRVIRWSMGNRPIVYLALVGMAGGAYVAVGELESELIPELHQGEFTVEATLPVGTPLEATDELVRPLERRMVDEVPGIKSLTTTVGSERDAAEAGERGEHTTRLRVSLVDLGDLEPPPPPSMGPGGGGGPRGGGPRGRRRRGGGPPPSAFGPPPAETEPQEPVRQAVRPENPEVAEEAALKVVRDLLEGIPDLDVNISRPVLFSFKTPVEIEIRGYDLDELGRVTDLVAQRVGQLPGLRDVKASIRPGNPEVQIVYDRNALARQNLDIKQVADLVRDKVQGNEATEFNRRDRKVPVRVRLEGITEASVDELRQLVVNPGGTRPVPLEAVADLEVGRGPNEIRRIGQQRVGIVSANLEGVSLGGVTAELRGVLAEVGRDNPDLSLVLTGQSAEWETSSTSLIFALALSIFLVYVIMASQFESVVYPLIILVTVPLALVGVVGGLWLLAIPMSVVVFLGGIMLVGIVVNNAIVLVDYVNQLKARGHDTASALETAGRVRLRPILMTTATTVLGLLPMALGLGDGAEIRTPMAVTVICGLVFSTVLTLIVIPTLYAAVDDFMGDRRGVVTPADALARDLAGVTPDQLVPDVEEAALGGGDPAGGAPPDAAEDFDVDLEADGADGDDGGDGR